MEAISVAGSVVGILSVTAKLATGLTELVERGKNVPDSIHSLVSELNDMRGCLAQLQPFLQDTQRSSASRTAMISLDQVVTINTSCVLTLSELEKFVDSFKGRQSLSRMDRLRWMKNESRIDRMLLRIRASRSSLNLILVILTWYALIIIFSPQYLMYCTAFRSRKLEQPSTPSSQLLKAYGPPVKMCPEGWRLWNYIPHSVFPKMSQSIRYARYCQVWTNRVVQPPKAILSRQR